MILLPVIEKVQAQLAADGGPTQPLIDFLRPLFMKNDPANGAERFNQLLSDPGNADHLEEVKSVLRDQLPGHPEGLHKLQQIVGE